MSSARRNWKSWSPKECSAGWHCATPRGRASSGRKTDAGGRPLPPRRPAPAGKHGQGRDGAAPPPQDEIGGGGIMWETLVFPTVHLSGDPSLLRSSGREPPSRVRNRTSKNILLPPERFIKPPPSPPEKPAARRRGPKKIPSRRARLRPPPWRAARRANRGYSGVARILLLRGSIPQRETEISSPISKTLFPAFERGSSMRNSGM